MSTIVLVAGACLGGWAWERVTPELRSAGHDVYPLTLTGFGDRAHLATPDTTLGVHAQDIVAAIEYAELHDVVLVAHSYGGAPATVAASRIPERIARIVYVAGVIPQAGKTLFEIFEPDFERYIQQLADAEGDGWRLPFFSDEVLDTFYGEHGFTPDDRAWLRARAAAQPLANWRDPAPDDLGAVEGLPRSYIVCKGDPGAPTDLPGFDMHEIATGHWPMVTAPADLARMIDGLARA